MSELLFALLLAVGAPDDHRTEALAKAAVVAPDPYVVLAVAHVESTLGEDTSRSSSGACCIMQLLGGRYGMPRCGLLEADAMLCVLIGISHLEWWRRQCGRSYLDAYNGGWPKCWSRELEASAWCHASEEDMNRCKSYGRKVRAKAAQLRRVR